MLAEMKDVSDELLEERLHAAPVAGTLTSDELAGIAEAEADFAARAASQSTRYGRRVGRRR